MISHLSDSERKYLLEGLKLENIRSDGRENTDYRTLVVENNVLPQVNGSSRVRLGLGTEILCSVKLEISEPHEETPQKGNFEVAMDISPSCVQHGGEETRRLTELQTELSEFLRSTYASSGSLDFDALCIIPAKYCWTVYVDLVVLQVDSNIIDACSLAMFVALDCTRVPALKLVPGERGTNEDFEVNGDLASASILAARDIPVLVTVMKVGGRLLLDASRTEMTCASSAITVAVDANGVCRNLHKQQLGVITVEDIKHAVATASSAAAALFPMLKDIKLTSARAAADGAYEEIPPIRRGFLF